MLTILGSRDFSYYHNAEVRFFDVSFICCPTHFSHAVFGLASPSDFERLRANESMDETTRLFCITAEAGNGFERDHFIAASHAEVTIKHVSYQ